MQNCIKYTESEMQKKSKAKQQTIQVFLKK